MSGENFPEKAEAFAAGLMVQAAWPMLLVAAAVMAAPVIGLVAGPQTTRAVGGGLAGRGGECRGHARSFGACFYSTRCCSG